MIKVVSANISLQGLQCRIVHQSKIAVYIFAPIKLKSLIIEL